jgi:hypothetical protein
MATYYELAEQENSITIGAAKSGSIPMLGESIAYVSSDDTF